MKKYLKLFAVIGGSLLLYGLFQNVFLWNFGWENTPKKAFKTSFKGVEDPSYSEQIAQAREEFRKIHKKSKAPGISIAISINSRMVWSEGRGYQKVEKRIPVDTSTMFRIGSTSKALTSLLLGSLLEQRKVSLDSSLQFYTYRFLNKPSISLRQLASHQSGIRNYGTCMCFPIWEYYRGKSFESIEDAITDFEQDALLFDPGERFSYSSYNYTALSLALQKAGRQAYRDLMNDYVFAPLDMNATMPDEKGMKLQNRSDFHDVQENIYKKAFPVNLSNKWAGGGYLSTPSDLVKAGNALLNEGFLSAYTIKELTTPQKLNDSTVNPQSYALGWRHSTINRYFDEKKPVEVIHHGGMAVGSQSLLVVFPEYQLVVSLLLNKSGTEGNFELFDYLDSILEVFLSRLNQEKMI